MKDYFVQKLSLTEETSTRGREADPPTRPRQAQLVAESLEDGDGLTCKRLERDGVRVPLVGLLESHVPLGRLVARCLGRAG